MLRNPILGMETQDDVNRNNSVRSIETKHGLIINWSSVRLKKSFVSKYRFGTPKILNKSVPRRNRNLFRYKMNRSLSCDIINSRKHDLLKLQNLSSDSSSLSVDNSSRELSRSAKIMRALSSNHKLFRHESTKNVKKSLNFDLTPSPKKYNNFGENQSNTSAMSTPSNILDGSLRYDTSSTDSSTSILITSSKSIDENQNQTPQHNRELVNILCNVDTTKSWDNLKLPTSTSLLRSELKRRIDDIVSNTASIIGKPFKQDNKRSTIFENMTTTSISRNLSHYFNEDGFHKFKPCTSANIIQKYNTKRNIDNIKKKSHKKEGSSCYGEQSFTKHMNSLIDSSDEFSPIESLRSDSKANNIETSTNQSQAENKMVRKMLFYDSEDELPDIESMSDCIDQSEVMSMRTEDNTSIEGSDKSKNYKIKSIDLNDSETYEENTQDSNNSNFMKDKNNKEDDIDLNMCCDKEKCLSHSNNNEMHEEKSSELDEAVTQDSGTVVTPKNRRNMHCILVESIKKSHKKSKGKDKKPLHATEIFQDKIKSDDILSQNDREDEECKDIIKNKVADTSCTSNSQNSARSSTPENINSTRLLLSQFSSIKKSHKKDKRSKRSFSSLKCHAYAKDINQLKNTEYETDTGETPCKNDISQFRKSSNMSHNEEEGNSMNIFMQALSNSSESLRMDVEYEPIDNEFKIYTPIRRRRMSPVAIDSPSCIHADETLPEKNMLMEINLSRCSTPVSHCLEERKLREEKYFDVHLNCDVKSNHEVSKEEAIKTSNLINEDGRSTPVNVSTSELFDNMESIKKSHKKNKHNSSKTRRRQICKRKQQSYIEETFSSSVHNATDNKKYEDIFHDDAQPSTSRGNGSDIESVRDVKSSKHLNTTPPNSLKTINFIKRLNTTSIKTLHKKDRNKNAQEKYILMTKEHELSDDGSIFDEEERLSFENSNLY